MTRRRRGRVAAGFLSMLAPGAGQLYAGARRRGTILLTVSAVILLVLLAVVSARPFDAAASLVDRQLVALLLVADLALLVFRLFAVVDAWRGGDSPASALSALALGVVAALTAAPHVAAGYLAVGTHDTLDAVFAGEEPRDVLGAGRLFLAPDSVPPVGRPTAPRGGDPADNLPAPLRLGRVVRRPLEASPLVAGGRPWVTVLLLGSDAGPGQAGDRTDTIILVALQRGTGRAVAFGIPRNLVEVPLGDVARPAPRRFHEPLNALYQFGRVRPELFPGGRDPGATALKQTVSRLLGVRVDYHALVDLAGFADMVDALGGVDIRVEERIVDSVTRPAWGEPKPTIDVYPGRTYHFFGREALAYVRSRKASSDYSRMARQRCFLTAMADQLDALEVLRRFGALAATVKRSVRTDIPLGRVPDLARLAAGIDERRTLTETFGPAYFARRRARDGYPVPNVRKIRATVRRTIVDPTRAVRGGVVPVAKAC
jgi:LCP family protein required for cell wall assembly